MEIECSHDIREIQRGVHSVFGGGDVYRCFEKRIHGVEQVPTADGASGYKKEGPKKTIA